MKKRTVVSIAVSVCLVAAALFIAMNAFGVLGTGRSGFGPPGAAQAAGPAGSGGGPGTGHDAAAGGGRNPAQSRPTPVSVAQSERRDLLGQVTLNGEIEAANRVTVYPEVSGSVARIEVAEGHYVRADQPLIYVDSSRPGAQFQASPVRSPIAGAVVSIEVERGAQAGPSAPVAVVATLNQLRITVEVPERYASVVRPGMQGSFTTFAGGDRELRASVFALEPVLDSATRSRAVKLRIEGSAAALQPGMFARVSLPLRQAPNAVAVPFRAVVHEGGKEYVYTVEDDVARRINVRTGVITNGTVQILSGLEPGVSVITEGLQQVRPNGTVEIVESSSGGGEGAQ